MIDLLFTKNKNYQGRVDFIVIGGWNNKASGL